MEKPVVDIIEELVETEAAVKLEMVESPQLKLT
jgi:hypothetical protein